LDTYSVVFLTLLIHLKVPQTLQSNPLPLIRGLEDISKPSSRNRLLAAVRYARNIDRSREKAAIFRKFDYQAMCFAFRRLLITVKEGCVVVQNLEIIDKSMRHKRMSRSRTRYAKVRKRSASSPFSSKTASLPASEFRVFFNSWLKSLSSSSRAFRKSGSS